MLILKSVLLQGFLIIVSLYKWNYYPRHSIQILDHGPKISHASTNLPSRGPTSTNLPACNPTLRISPLVVQHAWSIHLWTSSLATALKCEHRTYKPSRSCPHMRASLIWTSLQILITCSPPVTNLPARDIVKHLLVQVQHLKTHKTQAKEHPALCAIACRCLSAAKQNPSVDRLVVSTHRQAPHAPKPFVDSYRLAVQSTPPSTTQICNFTSLIIA